MSERADAGDPPVEAAFLEGAPFVERIAPALAGGGEVIGRDAGDADGVELLVELEDFGVSPDIGAVVVDEDGDIAHDLDALFGAVGANGAPLLVEEELDGLLDGEFAALFVEDGGHGVAVAVGVLGGPLVPAGVAVHAADDGEHGVVGEPGDVVRTELMEARAQVVGGPVEEVGGGLFDERQLLVGGEDEVCGAFVAGESLDAVPGDPALVGEALKTDEQGVSGEG